MRLQGEDAVLNQQAQALKRSGNYEEAISIYKNLLSRNPLCSAVLFYNLAKVYHSIDSKIDALKYYLKSLHVYLIEANNFDGGFPDQYWDVISEYTFSQENIPKKLLFRTDFNNNTRNVGKMISDKYIPEQFGPGRDNFLSWNDNFVDLEQVEGKEDANYIKKGINFAIKKINWNKIETNDKDVYDEYNNLIK